MPTRANSSAAYVHMYSLIAAEWDCNNNKFSIFCCQTKERARLWDFGTLELWRSLLVVFYLGQWRKEMLRGPTLMKTALLCRQLACSSP